jgi:hypothetical protein
MAAAGGDGRRRASLLPTSPWPASSAPLAGPVSRTAKDGNVTRTSETRIRGIGQGPRAAATPASVVRCQAATQVRSGGGAGAGRDPDHLSPVRQRGARHRQGLRIRRLARRRGGQRCTASSSSSSRRRSTSRQTPSRSSSGSSSSTTWSSPIVRRPPLPDLTFVSWSGAPDREVVTAAAAASSGHCGVMRAGVLALVLAGSGVGCLR